MLPILTDQLRELLTTASANPAAALRLAVIAPGGYGKTTLLRSLAQAYRDSGVDVVTDWPTTGAEDWRRAVMLIDDAHQLPPTQLRMLRELGCTRLIVACRPWPRPSDLTGLLHTLERVQLSPWDVGSVRQALCSMGLPESHAEALHALTGGAPRWVIRVAQTWSGAATAGDSAWTWGDRMTAARSTWASIDGPAEAVSTRVMTDGAAAAGPSPASIGGAAAAGLTRASSDGAAGAEAVRASSGSAAAAGSAGTWSDRMAAAGSTRASTNDAAEAAPVRASGGGTATAESTRISGVGAGSAEAARPGSGSTATSTSIGGAAGAESARARSGSAAGKGAVEIRSDGVAGEAAGTSSDSGAGLAEAARRSAATGESAEASSGDAGPARIGREGMAAAGALSGGVTASGSVAEGESAGASGGSVAGAQAARIRSEGAAAAEIRRGGVTAVGAARAASGSAAAGESAGTRSGGVAGAGSGRTWSGSAAGSAGPSSGSVAGALSGGRAGAEAARAGRGSGAAAGSAGASSRGVAGASGGVAAAAGADREVAGAGGSWGDVVVAAESMRFELESLDGDLVRYLVAARSGVGFRMDLLGCLLGRDSEGVGEVMRDARASGLLGQDGALLPLCGEAVARVVPAEQYLGVLQRLAELQLDRAEPILPFARSLLGSGATGSTVATVLETAAREVVSEDPALAAELFGAAVSAGRQLSAVVTEWARAAALAGDLDTALRLADQAILGQNPAGARVAGAAMAHRGQWVRSAALYAWAGDGPFAQIASIAVGSSATVPVARVGGPPTSLDGAAGLMAEGVRLSVSGGQGEALSMLVQASALLEPAGRDALLPDSPAAIAALVALHCGELDVAESVVDGAVAGRMGGDVMRDRHILLRAWIRMMRGRLGEASELIDKVDAKEPRDRLFLVALEVGLARRAGDTLALRRVWAHASECLVRHPVDLFTLLPLSEFIVAAARLRDPGRLGTAVGDAFKLLKRLGDPALWSAPLHWAAVQAAIITENSASAHVQALAANRTSYGVALAEAARCWVDVAAAKVEPDRVQAAAVALLEAGLWWDSARLASEAAIRTSDRKAMVGLLDCARQLQARQQKVRQPVQRPLITQETTSPLSDREREVADLVVQGLTYKQIGDKLFISAKTVEHHMARIRHRLGAANRSELITQLRALSGPQ